MNIGPRWVGLLIMRLVLWLCFRTRLAGDMRRCSAMPGCGHNHEPRYKRYWTDIDGIRRPAPWQCRCGYRGVCAVHDRTRKARMLPPPSRPPMTSVPPTAAETRCPCGYDTECAVYCGDGHQTGDCPAIRSDPWYLHSYEDNCHCAWCSEVRKRIQARDAGHGNVTVRCTPLIDTPDTHLHYARYHDTGQWYSWPVANEGCYHYQHPGGEPLYSPPASMVELHVQEQAEPVGTIRTDQPDV